jgi:hypothetical protein
MRSRSWAGSAGGASVRRWRTRPARTLSPTSWEPCSGGWSSECTGISAHAQNAPAPCPGHAPMVMVLETLLACSSIAHWQAQPRIAPACESRPAAQLKPTCQIACPLSHCDPSPRSSVVAGGLLQPPGRRPWRSSRTSTTAPLSTR